MRFLQISYVPRTIREYADTVFNFYTIYVIYVIYILYDYVYSKNFVTLYDEKGVTGATYEYLSMAAYDFTGIVA